MTRTVLLAVAALWVACFTSTAHAQLGDNLALGKNATQSSTLGGFTAANGVDGNFGNFTHTLAQADLPGPASWQVDLGAQTDVGLVILWNRTSCCGSRLRDIIVQILDADGVTVLFQTTDPDAPDPDALLNPENVLGAFPLGPDNLVVNVEDLAGDVVSGQFVRVLRLPDLDLSGTAGQGNNDESTVLSLGEVEVFESAPVCPDEGDTHCTGLFVEGPLAGDVVGAWNVSASATDDSGDPISYLFTARSADGATLGVGPQELEFATFNIEQPGTWTFSVTVDDSALCNDVAPDAVCEEEIEIGGLEGFTDSAGRILTKAFLVLGPFTHGFGCNGPPAQLLGNHIANARIDCEYPEEGDQIDYDPAEAVSTGYIGPEADGIPSWRLLDDGSSDNGDIDLNGDIGQFNDVMSWIVTYVEYTGADPVSVDICLGSDDGGQLWLDEKNLINDSTCRGRGDCDVMVTAVIEPGVHRLAAAAWNRGGGWGLRLSLSDPALGPIVDDQAQFPEWVFHGPTRPTGFEPPECTACEAEPVTGLTCDIGPGGLTLEWENPAVTDPLTPTRIEIDGAEVATVPSDETSATVPTNLLPEGFFVASVIHCGGIPATCTPFETDASGNLLGSSFLVLGPFTHTHGCGGPAADLEGNHIAPSQIGCLYPEEGDEVEYDSFDPNVASTGYVGPTSDLGLPIVRRFDDGSPQDGAHDLNGDIGQRNDVVSFLITYVEYTGDDPTTLNVCFGSDDGGQLWVNDSLVHTNNVCRGVGDCQDSILIPVDGPGVLRFTAGAWNRGGGWGLRLQLQDEFFAPIVDDGDNDLWVFHGATRPDADFPCTIVPPVTIADCERTDTGDVELAWDNPPDQVDSIVITANGQIIEELPGDATTVTIGAADLPDADPVRICVENGSIPPACCLITDNVALGGTADQSTTLGGFTADRGINGNLGDFTHTLAGNGGLGPAIWEVDLGAPLPIRRIVVFNRGDGCCQSRLRDIVVSVHDISFRDDLPLDPTINEVTDAVFPLWEDAIFESEILNEENELGGGGTGGPPTLEVDLSDLAIEGQFVRVTRIPDRDLSGSGGAGNNDEGDVLQMGEVQVLSGTAATPCPEEGDADFADTTCDGLAITGPAGNGAGMYTATASATDATGDAIRYTFTADNGAGTVLSVGPQPGNSATFNLTNGTWTVTATVDDSRRCDDPTGSCSEVVNVGAVQVLFLRGDTTQDGVLNITDAVKVFGILFLGEPDIPCQEAKDVNDDGDVNITDGIRILGFLFLGQPAPAAPGHEDCGPDPAGSPDLGCESHPPCDA